MSRPSGGSIRSVWRAGKRRCWICGRSVAMEDASRDHVRPRALGGYDKARNYRLAHRICNSSRGELPADMVRAVLRSLPLGAHPVVIRAAISAELKRFRRLRRV